MWCNQCLSFLFAFNQNPLQYIKTKNDTKFDNHGQKIQIYCTDTDLCPTDVTVHTSHTGLTA